MLENVMEKAVIVSVNLVKGHQEKEYENALKELNEHLAQGWSVKTTGPMSGTALARSCGLVILEKTKSIS